ncbi:MAG: glycosyltransferase family 4 protein [Firmicutes bacterium]|nr:glycosyltransferase family 4 protein [Bacillota bacterium]
MNNRINIGLFNDSFYPMADGVISVVDNYARKLNEIANVTVFVPRGKKKYDDTKLPYKVVRCKSIKIPFYDYVLPVPFLDFKFKKELKKANLDIVHIHSPFGIGGAGIKYSKKNNIPSIATMHTQFKKEIRKVINNEFIIERVNRSLIKKFNNCDECRAVNAEIARMFYEDYGYKTLPGVLGNATELKPVSSSRKANNYINKKHSLKSNELVFLFVGRITTLKNILFIVDSLKILAEKKPKLKFKMLFVGSGADEDKLISCIKKNKLQDKVILCGKITDREELACYYSRADLFLFPSSYDASSIVQIEAASQKTPTVFLKNSATASNVTDNINGFLSEYSTLGYANKIIEVVENKKLYKKVCENAYLDLYKNWDDTISEVYNIYLNMIKENKK